MNNHSQSGNNTAQTDFDLPYLETIYKNPNLLGKARVLLIEDDRTMHRMVSKSIGHYCDLIEAFNAGSGIAKYKNFDPDIVFLDLDLPDDSGHNILTWIIRNDPGAYVVLFSGHCDSDNLVKAMKNGAKGHVPKPFNSDLMMRYICECPKLH